MNRIFGDWVRVLIVAGLVGATTSTVWVKVQISETAMGMARARDLSGTLREERAKLQAAVDLAQRPGVVRARATRDLQMVDPMAMFMAELIVAGVGD